MMKPEEIDELEALHKAGIGVREIIVQAYTLGRLFELRATLKTIDRIAESTTVDDLLGKVISAEKKAKLCEAGDQNGNRCYQIAPKDDHLCPEHRAEVNREFN